MNRQVVPSMILSVLIVCFFAVLLYERERPRSQGDQPSAATKRETGTAQSPSAAPEGNACLKAANSAAVEVPEQARTKPSKQQGRSTSAVEPASSSSCAAPEGSATARDPGPTVSQAGASTECPAAARTNDAARAAAPAISPQQQPAVQDSPSSSAQTGPRSAFTTVQDGETLEDVAIRVYGSTDQLDVLWRANRDLLPRRNSPLNAGAVLRTPEE